MIPLSDYALVNENSTLYDTVIALDEAHRRYTHHRYAHRAVLVHDDDGRVVGKVSQKETPYWTTRMAET